MFQGPVGLVHIQKCFPTFPILSRNSPIPRINTSFFQIHPNISSSQLRLGRTKVLFPVRLPVKILKELLPSPFWQHYLPILIFCI